MSHPVNKIMASLRGVQGPPVKSRLTDRIDTMLRTSAFPEDSQTPEEPRADEYRPIKPPESWKAMRYRVEIEEPVREPLWVRVVVILTLLTLLGLVGYALKSAKEAPQENYGVSQNSVDRPRRADERVWKAGGRQTPPGRLSMSMLVSANAEPSPDPYAPKERIDL